MRRRRDWILLLLVPFVTCQYDVDVPSNVYEAQRISPPGSSRIPPRGPPPSSAFARGYQPPPPALTFNPPRSYFNGNQGYGGGKNIIPSRETVAAFQNQRGLFSPPAPNNVDVPVTDNWKVGQMFLQYPERFQFVPKETELMKKLKEQHILSPAFHLPQRQGMLKDEREWITTYVSPEELTTRRPPTTTRRIVYWRPPPTTRNPSMWNRGPPPPTVAPVTSSTVELDYSGDKSIEMNTKKPVTDGPPSAQPPLHKTLYSSEDNSLKFEPKSYETPEEVVTSSKAPKVVYKSPEEVYWTSHDHSVEVEPVGYGEEEEKSTTTRRPTTTTTRTTTRPTTTTTTNRPPSTIMVTRITKTTTTTRRPTTTTTRRPTTTTRRPTTTTTRSTTTSTTTTTTPAPKSYVPLYPAPQAPSNYGLDQEPYWTPFDQSIDVPSRPINAFNRPLMASSYGDANLQLRPRLPPPPPHSFWNPGQSFMRASQPSPSLWTSRDRSLEVSPRIPLHINSQKSTVPDMPSTGDKKATYGLETPVISNSWSSGDKSLEVNTRAESSASFEREVPSTVISPAASHDVSPSSSTSRDRSTEVPPRQPTLKPSSDTPSNTWTSRDRSLEVPPRHEPTRSREELNIGSPPASSPPVKGALPSLRTSPTHPQTSENLWTSRDRSLEIPARPQSPSSTTLNEQSNNHETATNLWTSRDRSLEVNAKPQVFSSLEEEVHDDSSTVDSSTHGNTSRSEVKTSQQEASSFWTSKDISLEVPARPQASTSAPSDKPRAQVSVAPLIPLRTSPDSPTSGTSTAESKEAPHKSFFTSTVVDHNTMLVNQHLMVDQQRNSFVGHPAAVPPPAHPRTVVGFRANTFTPPLANQQTRVQPANVRNNPTPDVVNNIIVHIFLNSKDKKDKNAAHATTKLGPFHGTFGVGTSLGGPGTHQNPIVITKDFDRDRLQFVDEGMAETMVEEGPANIVEVRAMVTSPDKKIEHTLNKAVDSELNRAIPVVVNRFHGNMAATSLDDDLRKELEQALVEEIAKNLGDTIDEMSDITEEDLSKAIEEGFTEFQQELEEEQRASTTSTSRPTTTRTTSRPLPPTTTTTTPRPTTTTTRRITITSPSTTTTTTTTTTRRPQKTTTTTPLSMNTFRIKTTTSPTTTTSTATTTTTPTTTTTTRRPTTTTTRPEEKVDKNTVEFNTENTVETHSQDYDVSEPIPTRPTVVKTTVKPSFAEENMMHEDDDNAVTSDVTSTPTTPPRTPEVTSQTIVIHTESTTSSYPSTPSTTSTSSPPPSDNDEDDEYPETSVEHRPEDDVDQLPSDGPRTTQSSTSIPTFTEHSKASEEEPEEPTMTSSDSAHVITKPSMTSFSDMNMITKHIIPPVDVTSDESQETFDEKNTYDDVTSSAESTSTTTVSPVLEVTSTTPDTPFHYTPDMFEHVPDGKYDDSQTPLTTTSERGGDVQMQPDSVVVPPSHCPVANDVTDKNRTDVLFLLDSSNAFNEDKFMHSITLILHTVDRFNNIGPDGTQVSLVQYNNEPYLEFSLRKHNCKQWLKEDIADTEYMTGGAMLGKALEKVSKFAFTRKRGDRPEAPNVLVIVTDGQSDDRIQQPVTIAKENNVTVLVIATLEADPQYLVHLAGEDQNIFHLDASPQQDLANKLADRIQTIGHEDTNQEDIEPVDDMQFHQHVKPVDINDLEEDDDDNQTPIMSINSEEAQKIVNLVCVTDGFEIQLNLPGDFEGFIVVKGQEHDDKCKKEVHSLGDKSKNSTVNMFVNNANCGVTQVKSLDPTGKNSTLVLQLLHEPRLRTDIDRAFLLQCFVSDGQSEAEVSTNLDVLKSEVMIAETISLSSVPPSCVYSIRKDSPNDPIVTKAFVGQSVYHRWECDGGDVANHVYGIQIHNCYASDDVEQKYPIVDNRGCSSDLAVLSDPFYEDENLTAYALSHAFGFKETESLKFVCKLSLCTRDGDGCEGVTPPTCGNRSHSDLLLTRKIRHQNSALESALTSALSTQVGVSSAGSNIKERLMHLAASNILMVLAAVVVLAIIITAMVTRYVRRPSSESSCSDTDCGASSLNMSRTSATSSEFGDGCSSSSTTHSGPSANPRLTEFLKSFNRNDYV